MTRKFTLWLTSNLLVLGICSFSLLPSQLGDEKDETKLSEKSRAVLAAKKKLVAREIKKLKGHAWAGQYYYGDHLGVNVALSLAPKSGFAYTWDGCLGLYDLNYGDVVEADGRIRLVFALPNEPKGVGIRPEFFPVLWGERHYLISADQLVRFANAINAGFEPRKGPSGRFLLKAGDHLKATRGDPNLPAEFSGYLLKEPIEAEISSVKDSRMEDTNRVTAAVLNAGANRGVKVGMEFWVYQPSGLYGKALATSVNDSSSEVTIDQLEAPGESHIPSPGWKLSTHVGHD